MHAIFRYANICLKIRGKITKMTQALHTTSSATSVQTFGSSGSLGASVSVGGWSSLSNKKTASFSSIQQEVVQTVTYSPGYTYKAYNPVEAAAQAFYTEQPQGPRRSRGENPGGNAVGDNTVPVGDMLLPLLAMAAAYIVVKLFRNRKISQAL